MARINRLLYRPEMYRQVARFSRKWNKLDFPELFIQVESELNPDRTSDPDSNVSLNEMVRGFLEPKPFGSPLRRNNDIRIFVDEMSRPDLRANRWCDRKIDKWNKKPEKYTRIIYKIGYDVDEEIAATKRKPAYVIPCKYYYLQTLRGRNAVRQVDAHIGSGITGLEQRREIIRGCQDTRAVDRAIEEQLEENRRIQYGNRRG